MNAAPSRPLRAWDDRRAFGLAATALLCSLAACTPEADDKAVKPGASAAAAATVPKPDYMAEHVARDAALSDALIGTWIETDPDEPATGLQAVIRYAADRSLSVTVGRKDKPEAAMTGTGTWSIAQGFLTYQIALAGSADSGSDEILRIDKGQLVYIDGNDKKTKIATRVADGALNAAALTAPPPPAPAVAAAPPADVPFFDDTLFVANEDVQTHVFRLNEPAQFRLSAEIEEKVPVSVIVQRDEVAPEAYLMALGVMTAAQVMSMFDSSGEKTLTNDLFRNRLSKRAVYGHFDSPWVSLKPGLYTVILDNSGQLSPSRGDAPVHLRLYSRPIP